MLSCKRARLQPFSRISVRQHCNVRGKSLDRLAIEGARLLPLDSRGGRGCPPAMPWRIAQRQAVGSSTQPNEKEK